MFDVFPSWFMVPMRGKRPWRHSMSLSTFAFPTRILFGPGALRALPANLLNLGINCPLVVTDRGLVNTDAFGRLAQTLGAQERGRKWCLYSGVHPNPVE